ncbi:hypothetical protein SCACP_21410 [Sporomusa carbonis]|uniref:hypothetical protein n=1 Tax=Sporomusa carbonis TaxID=3076075 RepID=UPI003A693787
MDLYIKQFKVRYQGQDYGPGSVLYGVPDALAKKLVDESNGAIEALSAQNGAKVVPDPAAEVKESTVSLPSVDPAQTVKGK